MQNTFPLCRKKIPSILFAGATRPKSSKFQLTQGGSPRTPHKILSRCAVRKLPPMLFVGATRPQVFQIPTYSRRVAPNPTQNTFPLCRKKTSPYAFCRGDPPPSLPNSDLLKAGRPEPHAKYFPAVP